MTIDGLMNFSIALLDSSGIYDPTFISGCHDAIHTLWLNESRNVYYDMERHDRFGALQNIYDILYNSEEVLDSCYLGMKSMYHDYNETDGNYTSEYYSDLLTNAGYHFSTIYEDL